MMTQIGVHDDDPIARREFQARHVRASQSQFPLTGQDLDAVLGVPLVGGLEQFVHLDRAIGVAILDDDDLACKPLILEGVVDHVEDERDD